MVCLSTLGLHSLSGRINLDLLLAASSYSLMRLYILNWLNCCYFWFDLKWGDHHNVSWDYDEYSRSCLVFRSRDCVHSFLHICSPYTNTIQLYETDYGATSYYHIVIKHCLLVYLVRFLKGIFSSFSFSCCLYVVQILWIYWFFHLFLIWLYLVSDAFLLCILTG